MNDAQTCVAFVYESNAAVCVQKFDDSRVADYITYRILLRSSSLREPRYPLLRVVYMVIFFVILYITYNIDCMTLKFVKIIKNDSN